jgi:hypothetical protein
VSQSQGSLSFDDCLQIVDDPAAYEPWREDFDRSAHYVEDPRLAVPDDLAERCKSYRFPDRATEILVAHRSSWDHPVVRRLGAHYQWLVAERYDPRTYGQLGFPPPPPECPLLYAYALIGLAGRVADEQAAAGIDPSVTADTFWDIGQQVMLHDRVYGEIDLRKGFWLCHHLAGYLFRIGRLQYQRSFTHALHGPEIADQPFLDVHIPEDGPLDPAACDRSFSDALAFFARHFPDEHPRWFGCHSWLLDPVLSEILPEGSNIVAFQRRFRITHILDNWPSRVFEFAFDRPDLDESSRPDLSTIEPSSSLHRAIIDHYRSGGITRMATGLIDIERA